MQLYWFLLGLAIVPVNGVEIDFEQIEHLLGFDIFSSTLRVRKYNHTATVLNGTLTLKTILNNNFSMSTELFHSRKGNQQFNHYPMKLPTLRLCDFMDNLLQDYGQFLDKVYNLPEIGECPITPRDVHTFDKIFPNESVPRFMPHGLWKAFVINSLNNREVVRFEMIVKVQNDRTT